MKLAEKYKAEIEKIPDVDVYETDQNLFVTSGSFARLRADKVTLVQKEFRVGVLWSSTRMVSSEAAVDFAASVAGLAALAGAIEKGEK